MPAKPASKNWDDIKVLMAALAVTITLGLWNLFATTDKLNITQKTVSLPPTTAPLPTQPAFRGKILLGGQAPSQQTIVVPSSRSQNAQQPAPVTRTRSS